VTDSRPRLLDLFSGAGGCARGYQLAGFHVTGVDNRPQPRYLHVGDAFIASYPCKADTILKNLRMVSEKRHVSLLEPTRAALAATGRPYVIENVPGAPLREPILLCGSMVGLLMIRRHRLFESNCFLMSLRYQHRLYSPRFDANRSDRRRHPQAKARVVSVAGHDSRGASRVEVWREAMGIDWMTRDELAQAIPPKYTEFIGRQLLNYV
jgi:DNA (cytosine-5)-methyltransferase 1